MFMSNLGQIAGWWFIVWNSWNLVVNKQSIQWRSRTWHIMQASFPREDLDGWSDMLDVPGTYRLVLNLSTMWLFVRPVLTSPICSSNAKSSCSEKNKEACQTIANMWCEFTEQRHPNTSYVMLSISRRISLCSSTAFDTSYSLEKSIIVACCWDKQNSHMSLHLLLTYVLNNKNKSSCKKFCQEYIRSLYSQNVV